MYSLLTNILKSAFYSFSQTYSLFSIVLTSQVRERLMSALSSLHTDTDMFAFPPLFTEEAMSAFPSFSQTQPYRT
jgi:hypothetical protein